MLSIQAMGQSSDFTYINWFSVSDQASSGQHPSDQTLSKTRWHELSSELDFTEDSVKAKKPQETSIKKLPETSWLKYIWLILIIGLIAVLVILLFPYFRNKAIHSEVDLVFDLQPESAVAFMSLDIEKMLELALKRKDYVAACRYIYLKTLQDMMHKNVIVYRKDKTNMDYLGELKSSKIEDPFRLLTVCFESVWYGGIMADDTKYREISILALAVKEALEAS